MPEDLMGEVLHLDPNDPNNTDPRETLDLTNEADLADYHRLLLFLSYLGDQGIRAQLLAMVARDIYRGNPPGNMPKGTDANEILSVAIRDVNNAETSMSPADLIVGVISGFASAFGATAAEKPEETEDEVQQTKMTYDLKKIADSAISLELLVHYAKQLPPAIFPQNCIPTREFVAECLRLFHKMKREAVAEKLAKAGEPDTGDGQPTIRLGVELETRD